MTGVDADLIKYLVRESITGVALLLVLWSYRRDYRKLFSDARDERGQFQMILEKAITAIERSNNTIENLGDSIKELIRGNQTLQFERYRRDREDSRAISEK